MKFERKFKPVAWGIAAACLLNVGLNFLLIPLWGYTAAAMTTCIAYLFLFLFYYFRDDFRFLKNDRLLRILLVSALVLAIQGLADLLIRKVFGLSPDKWLTLVEAAVFFGIYALILFPSLKRPIT